MGSKEQVEKIDQAAAVVQLRKCGARIRASGGSFDKFYEDLHEFVDRGLLQAIAPAESPDESALFAFVGEPGKEVDLSDETWAGKNRAVPPEIREMFAEGRIGFSVSR